MTVRIARTGLPIIVAVALAALWPVTAYDLSPVVLPLLMASAVTVVIVLLRPEFGIALAVAVAPFANLVVGGIKPFHLLLPTISFGILLYSFLTPRTLRLGLAHRLLASLGIFVAVGITSSVLSLSPSASLTKLVLFLSAAALLLATVRICTDRSRVLVIVGAGLSSLLLAGGQGVEEYLTGQHGPFGAAQGGVVVGRIQGSFGHPNQYGGFLATLLPLAVAVIVTRGFPRRLKWLALAGISVGVPALIFSYSRGALAALAIGPVLWMVFVRPRGALVAGIVIGALVLLFAPSAVTQRFQSLQGGDVAIRSDIWVSALDMFAERPVLGVGVNNFATAYARLPTVPSNASQRRLLHQGELLIPPHAQNLYLNFLAEEGLIGFAAFLFFAWNAALQAFRGSRSRDPVVRGACIGIGCGMTVLAVHSTLDVGFYGEVAFPLFSLIAAAALLAGQPELASDLFVPGLDEGSGVRAAAGLQHAARASQRAQASTGLVAESGPRP